MTGSLTIGKDQRIHFVGIGGMGMAPLAMVLAESGCRITGEDSLLSPEVARWLDARGIGITGSLPSPGQVSILVHSSAVKADHPSLVEARARRLPLLRRGEALAAYASGRRLIAVAGSHGKTSTCAMLVTALREGGMDVGYVLGGLFADEAIPPAGRGSSDWLVIELDESDGTIESFAPEITVCGNLDLDHCDRYRDLPALEATFARLAERTSGPLFFNNDCPVTRNLFAGATDGATISFGRGGDYDLLGSVEGGAGRVLSLGGRFGQTTAGVRARGSFNALNACAALAVAGYLGIKPEADLLTRFPGVRRRQSLLVDSPTLTVMEDYAHHPSEISALLEAIRPGITGRLLVCFQPHRYSRTARFKAEFARVLATADVLYLMEVYAASEEPLPGGRTEDLRQEFPVDASSPAPVLVADNPDGRTTVADGVREGDFLLFVGAGSIDRFARETVNLLCGRPTRLGRLARFYRALARRRFDREVLHLDEPLAAKTTIRIGGTAELYAEPGCLEDLQALLAAATEAQLPVWVLGRGSNLIVPDEGVIGLVLRLNHACWQSIQKLDENRFLVGAGLRLKELCGHACRKGWAGFEFLEGIPGTVGGALRMNAGAMGSWVYEVVDELHLVTMSGEVRILRTDELDVGYRSCLDLVDAIAIGTVVRPVGGIRVREIRSRIEAYRALRQESQPREPSAGCIFRNPEGDSAGRLIDELGLKGERIGDAEISARHANFIVNRGSATSRQVIALVHRVRERVLRERGVKLEPEVLLFGKDWEDVLTGEAGLVPDENRGLEQI